MTMMRWIRHLSFIKNASNSNPWQTEEYNEAKTKALKNVLNEFVYNGSS